MKPYISVIVVARNDNYGGNFLGRIQAFLRVLGWQIREFTLPVELIVVEWNPPLNRPTLAEALRWPLWLGERQIRVITVPRSVHETITGSERMQMFEYLAKNVGLRRAKGDFALVTNPDVFMSNDLCVALAAKTLDMGAYYRVDRRDFVTEELDRLDGQRASYFLPRRVVQVHIRPPDDATSIHVPIGWWRRQWCLLTGRWPGSHRQVPPPLAGSPPVVAIDNETNYYGGVHNNAAGDFLLTSLANWREIWGFPENLETHTGLDSYCATQLWALGLTQMLFVPPCCLYHVEHSRMTQRSRPRLELERFEQDLREIREGRLGLALNSPDWGFGDLDFEETFPLQGG